MSKFESLLKLLARFMQSAVSVCRGAQLLDPNLIASGGRSILFGAYNQLEVARRFGYQQYFFTPLWPAFGVELQDLLPIRPRHLHNYIDALLLDDHLQELIGAHTDPIGMLAPAGQLALDRLTCFKRADVLFITAPTPHITRLLIRLPEQIVRAPQSLTRGNGGY